MYYCKEIRDSHLLFSFFRSSDRQSPKAEAQGGFDLADEAVVGQGPSPIETLPDSGQAFRLLGELQKTGPLLRERQAAERFGM